MRSGRGIDELAGDPHPVRRLAYAAFEHVAHPQLAPDLLQIYGPTLVRETRIARDHEQPAHARQVGNNVLCHPIDEVFLLGIAAHVLERQHRDRGLIGQRRRGAHCGTAEADAINSYQLSDILELALAHIVICKICFPPDFLIDLARNTDTAWFRYPLKSRRNINAVAENPVAVVNHVAEINANAKLHAPPRLNVRIALDHFSLNCDGAIDRNNDARKLGQYAVACSIDDASAKLVNHWQDNSLVASKVAHRARFVGPHQGAVTGDVCGQDGCKPARLMFRQRGLRGDRTGFQSNGSITLRVLKSE